MRRVFWHLCGRFYEARASRAHGRYLALKRRAEEFFFRINGGRP
jgi:hypothetical protein